MFLVVGVLEMEHIQPDLLLADQVGGRVGNKGIHGLKIEGLEIFAVAKEFTDQESQGTVADEAAGADHGILGAGDLGYVVTDLFTRRTGVQHGAGRNAFSGSTLQKGRDLEVFLVTAPDLGSLARRVDDIVENAVFTGEHAGRDACVDRIGIGDEYGIHVTMQ